MSQVLVWWDSNGPNGRLRHLPLNPAWTKAEIIARFKHAYHGENDNISNVLIKNEGDLPQDRRWAKAWVIQNGNVVVNMTRAKALCREIVKDLWIIVAPSLRAKKSYALATADTADDIAVQAEIDQWITLRNSGAIQNATTTADLQAVIDEARTLAAPYLIEK